jgi:hypothetical protein
MKVLVIVPDGISLHEKIIIPSYVFRGTLLRTAEYANPSDIILIAPANKFNFEIYEQDAGENFLLGLDKNLKLTKVSTAESGYVDTLGNAMLLRMFIEKNLPNFDWKLTLFCYKLHAKRAKFAFESQGFIIDNLVETNAESKIENEKLPFRLFYYDYFLLHWLYEKFATVFQYIIIKRQKWLSAHN